MLIYIILMGFIVLLGFILKVNKNSRNKKIYLFIVFFIFVLISGFRSIDVGVDTKQYVTVFQNVRYLTISGASEFTRYEIGFIFLCKMLNFITSNYSILLFLTSTFVMSSVLYFIYKNSDDVILSTLLFVLLNYYSLYLTAMRKSIAIAIILLAYTLFLKKEKKLLFILSVILASLFHQSAIIMLLLVPISKLKYMRKNLILTILTTSVLFVSINSLFLLLIKMFPSYAYYQDSQYATSNYFASLLNFTVILVFFIFGLANLKLNKNKVDKKASFLYFMTSFSFLSLALTMKIIIFNRIAPYFEIFNIIWIPLVLRSINDKKKKEMFTIIIIVCSLLYWLIIAIFRPEWYGIVPYTSILDGSI